jgi:probable blue pigment (indigoidine) exporter
MNHRLKLILLTAVAPSVWGSTYLVTTELLPPDRPLLAAVLRALPAGVLLLLIAPGRPRGAWWGRAALLGTLNIGAFFALLFLAAYRLPGGVAATVTSLQPLLVAGLAAVVLAERVRARTAVAGLIGVVGVALLVLRADAALDAVGVLAAVGAAVSMATGVVLSKR